MSKKAPITMASLGLTPGEAELFANGARHLFADPDHHDDEPPAQKPQATAPSKSAAALEDFTVSGGKKAGPKPVAKKSQGKPH